MTKIDGEWIQVGAALNQDGSTLYDWEANFLIESTGDAVRVSVATERSKSQSVSRIATLQPNGEGGLTLLYDYIADPMHEGTASHDFFGMTRIAFAPDGQSGEGNYLNYNGRYTFGRLSLKRR